MENKTTWISLGIFIAVLVVGAFLLSNQNMGPEVAQNPTPTPRSVETETTDETGEEAVDGEVTELTIEAEEFSFTPSTATVETGTISITYENVGTMGHDLVFEDLDARTQVISPGETETIELTIDEPGTYTFYCSVNGHRSLGMEGELVVE